MLSLRRIRIGINKMLLQDPIYFKVIYPQHWYRYVFTFASEEETQIFKINYWSVFGIRFKNFLSRNQILLKRLNLKLQVNHKLNLHLLRLTLKKHELTKVSLHQCLFLDFSVRPMGGIRF